MEQEASLKCPRCGQERPASEYLLHRRSPGPHGVRQHRFCRACRQELYTRAPVESPPAPPPDPGPTSGLYERWLSDYERMIGAREKRAEPVPRRGEGEEGIVETVVISDLHVPDERFDLLAGIVERHAGARLVIAGDLDDFEMLSRFDRSDWTSGSLREALARRDALLDYLTGQFASVEILLGNHDLRMPRRAASVLGPDYAWISQQFLLWAYERRHGIRVVTQPLRKQNGREIPMVHYYTQVGDCVIGHIEVSGKPVGRSAERAHDFYTAWRETLGLRPFRVVLQAHCHRLSYFMHPSTRVHCYEIGALCDVPTYALTGKPNWTPPQHGYFHLVQENGVTDVNASRLYCLD